MPLLANFESPDTKNEEARANASRLLAQAFELIQRAVTNYELSADGYEESVDALLKKAIGKFQSASEAFQSIEVSMTRFENGGSLSIEFPRISFGIGPFAARFGQVGTRRFRRSIKSEGVLIDSAVAVCRLAESSLANAGLSWESAFENHIRMALIDLSQLHAIAVALSEAFARLTKG